MDAHLTKPTKPAGFALSNPVPQTKWEAQREKERSTLRYADDGTGRVWLIAPQQKALKRAA